MERIRIALLAVVLAASAVTADEGKVDVKDEVPLIGHLADC